MANIAGLDETLAYIEAHPEQHSQMFYGTKTDCGTVACFAGWRLLLTNAAEYREYQPGNYALVPKDDSKYGTSCFIAAQESLDLTFDQASALFYDAQDLAEVRETVERIKNGETVFLNKDDDE